MKEDKVPEGGDTLPPEKIKELGLSDAEKLLAALDKTKPEDIQRLKFGDLGVPKSERKVPRSEYESKFTKPWQDNPQQKKKRRKRQEESRRKNRKRRKR